MISSMMLIFYLDEMYRSINSNTAVLPSYFRVSVFSAECLSPGPDAAHG